MKNSTHPELDRSWMKILLAGFVYIGFYFFQGLASSMPDRSFSVLTLLQEISEKSQLVP